jgi:acetate---CoA ligase (ADP-forming)
MRIVLEGILAPRSVAVVGAAREAGKVGRSVFDNLLAAGFPGPVWPVNPRADEIAGHRSYPDLTSLPEVPDLAVIVVPPAAVIAAVEECGRVGCHSVIVITAGFKEAGPEGARLERELLATARRHDIRLLGPNCLGIIATPAHLDASFAADLPGPGGVAVMSQSGALGTAILDWAASGALGMSYFVSLGNKADLSETDFLDAWRDDEHATVVVAYLESVSNGPAFVTAAAALTGNKPFVALKAGSTDAGARAVSSHTGSLAGSEAAYDAAFERAGVIRAQSVEELFDLASAFSTQPLPKGAGVAILTNAGGPAIMATDACERAGLSLAPLERETVDALRAALPPAAALYNPVDVLGDADAGRYRTAAGIIAADPNVHALLVILTPQAMTDIVGTADAIAEVAGDGALTTLACFMGEHRVGPGVTRLHASGVPVYPFPERAVGALAGLQHYRGSRGRPLPVAPQLEVDRVTARAIVGTAQADGRTFVTEQDAAAVAAAYGIPVPKGGLARDLAAVRRMGAEIGFPLAMKVASPDILHKSDIGGIRLGIEDEAALVGAYEDLIAGVHRRMPDAQLWGVELQEMIGGGVEVIVGVNRDPTFGPLLLFGLGGVFVEALRDVVVRLCPVDHKTARQMIDGIRGSSILRGARGRPPVDIEAVADVLVRVSQLALDLDEVLELDINPLMVRPRGMGAIAADIRIGIGGTRA